MRTELVEKHSTTVPLRKILTAGAGPCNNFEGRGAERPLRTEFVETISTTEISYEKDTCSNVFILFMIIVSKEGSRLKQVNNCCCCFNAQSTPKIRVKHIPHKPLLRKIGTTTSPMIQQRLPPPPPKKKKSKFK